MDREAWLLWFMGSQRVGHDWATELNWTAARQAPLSLGFPRQEYWSGLPFPSPRDLPYTEIGPRSSIESRFFTIWVTREALAINHSGTLSCSNCLNSPLSSPSMIQSFTGPNQEAVIWYAEESSRWQRDTRHLAHPSSMLMFNSYFPRLYPSLFRFHRWAGGACSSSTGGVPLGPAPAPLVTGNEAAEVVKALRGRRARSGGGWLVGWQMKKRIPPWVTASVPTYFLIYFLEHSRGSTVDNWVSLPQWFCRENRGLLPGLAFFFWFIVLVSGAEGVGGSPPFTFGSYLPDTLWIT